MNLSEKLKSLRVEKGVSQEKLAKYLNVSFQAVSKWETGNAYPDILLLPAISRFFGITVDELLQAEVFDEEQLYCEYERKAGDLFRCGKYREMLELWKEAYQKMPGNVKVQEMLMAACYDTDKIAYLDEIIELGTEICHSDAGTYYKGQAIALIANTYAANGNLDLAEKWAGKSYLLMHAQDILLSQIQDGDELLHTVGYCTYWFFDQLFYMAARIDSSDTVSVDAKQKKEMWKTVVQLYEALYQKDDMSFESLQKLYLMHRSIAVYEAELAGAECSVKRHLERALACVERSTTVQEHALTHSLLWGWHIEAAPSDNTIYVRQMQSGLLDSCFDRYRNAPWFITIEKRLRELLSCD